MRYRVMKQNLVARRMLAWALGIAFSLIIGGCRDRAGSSTPQASARKPDVLLITVDTLRADRLGYAGHPDARTPNLDRLAAGGTVFTQAITTMPRTTPGLASLLTGLWPHHHGSREVGDPILAGRSLTEVLAEHGYFAAAVSANGTAGPEQGLAAGFHRFVSRRDISDQYEDRLYRDVASKPNGEVGWGEATTDIALELTSEAPIDQPLFLWVFYFDPHFIYRPPSPWQDEIEAESCRQLYAWGMEDLSRAGMVFNDIDGVASTALEDCAKLYDAEVAYTDAEIGRLLRGIEELRDIDDALLVFTADHGENLGEGGLFYEHGDNLHDAGLRVPLLFSGPRVAKGREDHGSVSLVDVAATVISWLGFDPAVMATDGVDLSGRLVASPSPATAKSSRRRSAAATPGGASSEIRFAESATSLWNESVRHLTTGRAGSRACIHAERMTLCRDPQDDGGTPRLYDHIVDPLLRTDIADRHREIAAELLLAWNRWPPETGRYLSARTPEFKLMRSPMLEGGYQDALFDLLTDPTETVDVSSLHPRVFAALTRALDAWASPISQSPLRVDDEARLQELRALGYIR